MRWRQFVPLLVLTSGLGALITWEVVLVVAALNDWKVLLYANQYKEGLLELVLFGALIPIYIWSLWETFRPREPRK